MKGPGKDRERARATQCFHSASSHEPTSHGAESRARADEGEPYTQNALLGWQHSSTGKGICLHV